MRIIFFLFVLFYSYTSSFSQRIQGGIIAGFNASQVSGDALSGFDKAGITAGVLAKTVLSEKVDFEIELLYVQKGSKKNIDPDKNDYLEYLLQLNYAEVPLIIKYKLNDKWTFDVGVSYGRLVFSREADQSGDFPESIPFKKDELSINGGINYYLFRNLIMNWRISNSVLPVRPHQSGASYRLNQGQYNTLLMFLFKYEFGNQKGKEN